MYTKEIIKQAASIPRFIGVYPLDKIPLHICPPCCFIVNTDTHNLGGKHWLAISYENGGIVYAFDPLGLYYPPLLVNKLHRIPFSKIIYNTRMYQLPWEKTCGLHCLTFLKFRANGYKHR